MLRDSQSQQSAHTMSEAHKARTPPPPPPPLQKPPGYRDPAASRPPPPLQKPPGYRDTAASRPPPPRRPQLPPSLRRPGKPAARRRARRPRCSCCRVLCWISGILITLALLLAIAGTLAYLWFQPRLPVLRVVSIQAPKLRLSPGPDGALLDAATAVRIQASNPNGKISLAYAGSEARVAVADDDGDVDVGSGTAAEFAQGRRNSTVLRYAAAVKGVLVGDVVGARLRSRIKSKEIQFSVEVRTRVGIQVGGKRTGTLPIQVVCGAVSLKRAASGAVLPKCQIYLFRWINLH